MTTRMRRHAEGLLILSGNPPGRAWRRPVRLAEVVRAAVGEVEDYGRVTVRRMPRVDLAGAAVADVLHLVAELIENAAAFSPPDSRVVVRGRPIEDGYLLEITDRGLGMRPEPLAAANAEIVRAGTSAELPETDRLGLFTVGRLAARQGVTVRLRPGAKGGTVAEVRVPAAVLAPAADAPDEPETGEVELRPRVAAERVAAAAASGGPPVRGTADPAAAGEAGPDPARTAASAGRRRATGPVPAPEPPGGERTRAGLPKRARQASLVVRPREGAASGAGAPAEPPRRPDDPAHTPSPYGAGRERSPAEARSTMAAFARGLARGRAVGTNHDHDHDHATGESGERP
jgi:anti-sigma regulatory factor (Ser/Thr protein kinase)